MSIYDTASIGTASNKIEFNTTTDIATYRLVSRAPQRRNVRELDLPIPFENGISDFETLIGRYAYTLEGIVYPNGVDEQEDALKKLRKLSSLELAQSDADSDEGYVPYQYQEVSGPKIIFVKVLYVEIREDTRKGLVQPFVLVCKIKDPTIFGATLKTATTEGSDPTTASGSAVFPFSYPIIYGASTYSVTSTATNDGDLPAYPSRIRVYGPVNSPVITNETTGESIRCTQNLNSSSDVLEIRYGKDFLTAELNGTSVLNDTNGTFFKLRPGGNQIALSGSSIGSGAYVELNYRDAYPLS